MLTRAEAPNLSPLITIPSVNSASALASFDSRKRLCKSWPSKNSCSRNDMPLESPSPSSTISSSFASEGGTSTAAAGGSFDVSSQNVAGKPSSPSEKWLGEISPEERLHVMANDPIRHDEGFLTAMDELESMFLTSPSLSTDLSLTKLLLEEGTEGHTQYASLVHRHRPQLDLQEAMDAQLSCMKAPAAQSIPSPFQPTALHVDPISTSPFYHFNPQLLPSGLSPFLLHHESLPPKLYSNPQYTASQMLMADRLLPGLYLPFQEALPTYALQSMPCYAAQDNKVLRKGQHLKPDPEQQLPFINNTEQLPPTAQVVKIEPKSEETMSMPPNSQDFQVADLQRFSQVVQEDREEIQFTMVDNLLKAAEAVELGNSAMAEAILARLNQYLSPHGNSLHRAAFHFKEALAKRIDIAQPTDTKSSLDILAKINAYKIFCECSVLPQFAHFTANQVLLEAMEGEGNIHLIDFEVGVGGQWASFLQEVALRPGGPPRLRITTVGRSESIEMQLTRENLCEFARSLNTSLEFQVISVPKLDNLNTSMFQIEEREAIAVNFAFGFNQFLTDFPSTDCFSAFRRFLNELSPKVITVVDMESHSGHGSSFLKQFNHALQFYASLFSSLESMMNLPMEAILEIEKLLFAPRITNLVRGARRVFQWASLLRGAGFSPIPFSSKSEIQANCLIQNLDACSRGFAVSKYQESLLLGWQGRTLLSAYAWSC